MAVKKKTASKSSSPKKKAPAAKKKAAAKKGAAASKKKASAKKKAASKKKAAPKKKASAKKKAAPKKKAAAKKEATSKAKKAAPPKSPDASKAGGDAGKATIARTSSGGSVSSMDVNHGHVFALRPRVNAGFRPHDFMAAKRALRDEGYETLADAARAVAEEALALTRGDRAKIDTRSRR